MILIENLQLPKGPLSLLQKTYNLLRDSMLVAKKKPTNSYIILTKRLQIPKKSFVKCRPRWAGSISKVAAR